MIFHLFLSYICNHQLKYFLQASLICRSCKVVITNSTLILQLRYFIDKQVCYEEDVSLKKKKNSVNKLLMYTTVILNK